MGQPKFPKKKYETPNHPWQGDRIKEEHDIRRKFGLKNKTEIWKAQSVLRSVRGQARGLISRGRNPDDHQAHQEAKLLLARLHREGYVADDASLNEVLGLDVERILNRRLQSQVYLKGMARTPKQARQFVSHGHILVNGKKVTVPSYQVREGDEIQIKEKSRELGLVLEALESPGRDVPDYLDIDFKAMKATFVRTPLLADVPYPVQMEPSLVVEYYSR